MIKPKVLCVDDEEDLLSLYLDCFSALDFEVHLAENGQQAYKSAREQFFDVIVTDYNMPILSGLDLIRGLREGFYNKDTPIFLISAYVDDIREKVEKIDKVHIIHKPFNVQDVSQQIKEFLDTGDFDVVPTSAPAQGKTDEKGASQFINSFLDSVRVSLSSFLGFKNVQIGKPEVCEGNADKQYDVTTVFSLISEKINGNLSLSFSDEVHNKFIDEMKKNQTFESEHLAIGELSKLIYMKAMDLLEDKGIELKKTHPIILLGNDHKVLNVEKGLNMTTKIQTEFGEFDLQFFIFKK